MTAADRGTREKKEYSESDGREKGKLTEQEKNNEINESDT